MNNDDFSEWIGTVDWEGSVFAVLWPCDEIESECECPCCVGDSEDIDFRDHDDSPIIQRTSTLFLYSEDKTAIMAVIDNPAWTDPDDTTCALRLAKLYAHTHEQELRLALAAGGIG